MTSPAPHARAFAPLTALAAISGALALTLAAGAQVSTVPTMDPLALKAALNAQGLTITSIIVRNGMPGQIGTYSGFNQRPVTIRDGIVLSSGSVASLGPLAEVLDPLYEPSSPPAAVNSEMYPPEDNGGTSEFDAYGAAGKIANFTAGFDVASLEVKFTLAQSTQVKFDFIFGTVEFPVYTSSYTDAFLVFLDGTDPVNQITYDTNNDPVQVGASFAGLTVTNDINTAFAAPHGLIHHLTTTTAVLSAGNHSLRFEVGDVNDHILDSAAFIANLRTGTGGQGTVPTDDDRFGCSPADIAYGDGEPLPPFGSEHGFNPTGPDGGDFDCFFNFYFAPAPDNAVCDIAYGDGEPLPPFGNENGFNSGVDGGDFDCFFNYYFSGCL